MFRWVFVLVSACVFGCGGPRAAVRTKNADLRSALADIDRKNRNKMRDLENQIVVLQDRLQASERENRARLALPVEVRTPNVADNAADDEYQVVGSDEDGVEIVYIGDAANNSRSVTLPGSDAARSEYVSPGFDDPEGNDLANGFGPASRPDRAIEMGPSERMGRRHAGRSHTAIPFDGATERLATTGPVGPTVDEQIRRARSARPIPPVETARRATDSRRSNFRTKPASRPKSAARRPKSATRSQRSARPQRFTRQKNAARPKGAAQHGEAAGAPGDTAGAPGDTAGAPSDPKTAYQASYQALRDGDHERAIAGFRDFLARHPSHDYADNARYWLGESFYDQRNYHLAMTEFRKVLSDYPQGNKVPAARLKIGYCYLAVGDTARARSTLAEVIEHHPDSSPARLAARRLDSLTN